MHPVVIVEVTIMKSTERGYADEVSLEGMTREEAEAAVGIEPACEDCLAVRAASAGTVVWCARHDARHVRAHRHYELPPSFALGTMLFRPTG